MYNNGKTQGGNPHLGPHTCMHRRMHTTWTCSLQNEQTLTPTHNMHGTVLQPPPAHTYIKRGEERGTEKERTRERLRERVVRAGDETGRTILTLDATVIQACRNCLDGPNQDVTFRELGSQVDMPIIHHAESLQQRTVLQGVQVCPLQPLLIPEAANASEVAEER
jgi:hypothetical protein